jgi:hypothetical protein
MYGGSRVLCQTTSTLSHAGAVSVMHVHIQITSRLDPARNPTEMTVIRSISQSISLFKLC